ncbi:hypothetical protein GX50_08447 [[Emmonsia] crescens]|uniref:N-acetyltransferase domain-containing protein n=1 Tax=[Emmonsia] crescens TaxID=73230 RepID=A0A2B7Z6N7_9EURO|nr:hypothetical protein GX50_08447 [Emmonsia crescens]
MANPPPKIRILPAQLEDASALSMVEWDAYSCDPVSRAMFGEYTPEGSEVRAKEIAEGMAKKDPNTHYIKAVLGDDTIIAVGIWHFYLDEESSKAIEVMDVKTKKWSTGANVDACMDFFGKIYKMRERMRGQRHAYESQAETQDLLLTAHKVLSSLATDIAHQGLGAGSAVLKYGVDIADKENVPGWLEASVQGYNLYKKFGFQDVDSFTLDLSRYGGEGERSVIGMSRPARQN